MAKYYQLALLNMRIGDKVLMRLCGVHRSGQNWDNKAWMDNKCPGQQLAEIVGIVIKINQRIIRVAFEYEGKPLELSFGRRTAMEMGFLFNQPTWMLVRSCNAY